MLGQSKTAYQAEIDTCELIDFLRFNVYYLQQIYDRQPNNTPNVWNRIEYRPLEGFVTAISPFNFTSIGANLPTAPAIAGNVVLWKPATTAVLSNYYVMQALMAAGLPAAVSLRAIDQNGNLLPYCGEAVQLSVEGPVKILGPSVVPLRGGMAGTYLATTGEAGRAVLHCKMEGALDTEAALTVRKRG